MERDRISHRDEAISLEIPCQMPLKFQGPKGGLPASLHHQVSGTSSSLKYFLTAPENT